MKLLHTAMLAAAALALAGCATNPISGRSQLMVVSEETAISSSAAAYNNMMGGLGKKKQIEAGTAREKKVREITDRLVAQAIRFRPDAAGWKWEVQVISDPKTVNAFCMAGGKMAIYTGMWEKLKATDDEVAQVMGHEIGHALLSHTREKMSVAYSTSAAAAIATIALGGSDQTAALLETAAQVGITLPNSRQAESEADQVGIELAARAGYDPQAAITLWEKMAKLGGTPPEFLSTHPSPEHREQNLKALGAQVEPLYLAAREGKPTEADVMTFRSVPYNQFRTGTAELKCRLECAFGYNNKKGDWRKLHEQKNWRDLALSVMDVGYLGDLSYFMLAEAAKGLNLPDAAKLYYRRALDSGKQYGCAGGLSNTCEGFEVQKLSAAALAR